MALIHIELLYFNIGLEIKVFHSSQRILKEIISSLSMSNALLVKDTDDAFTNARSFYYTNT